MTRDEIMELTMEEIEARRAELRGMVDVEGADLDAMQA